MAISIQGTLNAALSTSGVAALNASVAVTSTSSTTSTTATGAASTVQNSMQGFQPTNPNVIPIQPNTIVNAPDFGPGSLQFPGDIGKYIFKITLSTYSRENWNSVGSLNTLGTIYLPMPEQLVDSATVNYQQVNAGIAGAAIMSSSWKNAYQAMTQSSSTAAYDAAIQSGAQNLDGFIQRVLFGGLDAAATATLGALGNQEAALNAKLGMALNEYLTVMLSGPSYKVREFSWKFSPRNDTESNTLNQIIAILKNAQAPSFSSTSQMFFSWPNIFQCQFLTQMNQDLSGWLYAMKPAVCNDLVVNYSPSIPAFHRFDSSPESIQIMLRLTELEFWLSGLFLTNDPLHASSILRNQLTAQPVPPSNAFEGGVPLIPSPF